MPKAMPVFILCRWVRPFKQALFERIEDEYDIAIADEAYHEYLKNPKTYTHSEARELLDL